MNRTVAAIGEKINQELPVVASSAVITALIKHRYLCFKCQVFNLTQYADEWYNSGAHTDNQ